MERLNVIDEARGGSENEALGEEGCEGSLEGGSCRMRRRPDAPSPTSWSEATGDMIAGSFSFLVDPASKEKRIRAFSGLLLELASRFPVLLVFGIRRTSACPSVDGSE